MVSNDNSTHTPTESPTTFEQKTEYLAQIVDTLDPINQAIFYTIAQGLIAHNSADIKTALDWSIEHNGSSPEALDMYTHFGIVPYVLEAKP
ncbi:hypothetical protein [Thiofilum flexile]|uniref:hypothetical protein n=1 Tax=Thiofilum flexile TaxID=125627 RepID=UPI00037567FA|nr:hypothetical protein [Thiofilum flexile]